MFWGGINESSLVKCFRENLAHSKHSIKALIIIKTIAQGTEARRHAKPVLFLTTAGPSLGPYSSWAGKEKRVCLKQARETIGFGPGFVRSRT